MMELLKKYRLWIAGAIVVIAGIYLLTVAIDALTPPPDNTEFKSRNFSFTYPRVYTAEEYSPEEVSIGTEREDGVIDPLVQVVHYKSDPDVAVPASFDAFVKRQAAALCGSDAAESVTCTEVGTAAYTSPTNGAVGQKLNLTLVRKNLTSGTTTSSTYGPLYVFNTTTATTSTPEDPLRYSAIFIYPSLQTFLSGATTSQALLDQVINTFVFTP
jgi:hypothetical protein